MNKEKVLAKSVSKIYSGKAKDKELLFVLDYALRNSTLGKSMGEENLLPVKISKLKNSDMPELELKGVHNRTKNEIYINVFLVKAVLQGQRDFFEIVDTVGHEETHRWQHVRGDNMNEEKKKSKSQIVEFLNDFGFSADDDYVRNVAEGSYRRMPIEIDARKGGYVFAQEFLRGLLNNRYLEEDIKTKITNSISSSKLYYENNLRYDNISFGFYNNFIREMKTRLNAKKFADTANEGQYNQLMYNWAMETCFDSNDFESLEKNFRILLDEVPKKGDIVAVKLISLMDKFPERKENFKRQVINTFENKDIDKKHYSECLKYLLNEEECFDLYRSAIKKDVKKVNAPLFRYMKKYGFTNGMTATQVAKKRHAIFMEEVENNRLKINTEEDARAVISEIRYFASIPDYNFVQRMELSEKADEMEARLNGMMAAKASSR